MIFRKLVIVGIATRIPRMYDMDYYFEVIDEKDNHQEILVAKMINLGDIECVESIFPETLVMGILDAYQEKMYDDAHP